MESLKQLEKKEEIIRNYVTSYNNFDINGMLSDIDADIIFENRTNGKIDLEVTGIKAFEKQAETAMLYFTTRRQKIEAWYFDDTKVSIDVYYKATLSMDLPNGMKTGDIMELKGRTEFVIENGKIKSIRDFSET